MHWRGVIIAAVFAAASSLSAYAQTTVGAAFNSLVDKTSQPAPLVAKNYDAVFLVATWCPYSRDLVQIIKARMAKGSLPDTSLAFVVTDEWDKFVEAAPQEGWSAADLKTLRKQLEARKKYPVILAEQDIISTYPGDVFFYRGEAKDIKEIGYPSAYVRQVDRFSVHGATALEMLGVPMEEMSAFYEGDSIVGSN